MTLQAFALVGVGLACQSSPTAPVATVTVRLITVVDDAFELRVHNVGTRPVLLSGCPDAPSFIVERSDGDRWSEFSSFNVVCLAIYTQKSLIIVPGDSMVRRVDVTQRGTFRARVYVGPDWGRPLQVLTSAPVTLP